MKMDDGTYELVEGLATNTWQWKELTSDSLTSGEHTLAIAYCENGARLDKINISDFPYAPSAIGEEALNICVPDTMTVVSALNETESYNIYALGQNYPNPFYERTSISFETPDKTFVSLKVFNMLGVEIAELGGREFNPGKHTVEFNPGKLPEGSYFYTIKTDRFAASRKMMILVE